MTVSRRSVLAIFCASGVAIGLSSLAQIRAQAQNKEQGQGLQPRFLRIGAGPLGATYFAVGSLIATAISNPPGSVECEFGGSCGVPGVIAATVATEGSVSNIRRLVDGTIDLAICQADVARQAINGSGRFAAAPVRELRTLASLYPEAVHVVVRRAGGITSIAGLRNKRVSLEEQASGTLVTATAVLKAYGLAIKDIVPRYEKLSAAAEALAAGTIDAFFMVAGAPVSVIARLADTTPIALLPIAEKEAAAIAAVDPSLLPTVIPAGSYTGVNAIQTVGPWSQLLVSAAFNDDLAFAITKALWDPRNRKVFDSGHPQGRNIRLATAQAGLVAPLHPGADRFYQEAARPPAAAVPPAHPPSHEGLP